MFPKRGQWVSVHILIALTFGLVVASDGAVIDGVFNALEKLRDYVEPEYERVNLDGLAALRMCEGLLSQGVTNVKKRNLKVPPATLKRAENILRTIRRLNGAIYKNLMAGRQAYDMKFQPLVVGPLNGTQHYRHVNAILPKGETIAELTTNLVRYNEDVGDTCYTLLFGTAKYMETMLPKCTVSKRCMEFFLSEAKMKTMTGYGPTHSALYVYFAKISGCEDEIQARVGRPLKEMLGDICSKSYAESVLQTNQSTVPFRDLFMETIVVCGGLFSFKEYFRKDWWNVVQNLQEKSGCFINKAPALGFLREVYEINRKKKQKSFRSRKLMKDSSLSGDCTSHITGMGSAVMGTYARYLLEHGDKFFM